MSSDRRHVGPATHRLARVAPVAVAGAVAYCLARFAPYWVVGVNRWVWWFAVLSIANTCLVLGDRVRSRVMGSIESGQG